MTAYQSEFGEVVDMLREKSGREIPYKSEEWNLLYTAFVMGRVAGVDAEEPADPEAVQMEVECDKCN